MPQIRVATEGDRATVIDTLTLGFASDPFIRWLLPVSSAYLAIAPQMTEAFGGGAIDAGSAYIAGEGKAAALWIPPGLEHDDNEIGKILSANVRPEIKDAAKTMFADMDAYHSRYAPCWFLSMIAADPAWLGQGLGGALMKHALRRVDEDGLPAYLESSNPRNISLYLRHGFEILGEIRHGSSPVVTPMLRPARR
ncbi:GNAT family N-acetyltransferase [Parasphingopyxis lamellibrachiae]|nr:GNAT family N-acetyltransferase [Parasphingopyxis lamellibrachiae]